MKRKSNKTYPLLIYLCLLLSVAAMCTGVTFSRYVTSSGGAGGVGVSPFECSFSVDEISSTAFANFDYVSESGAVMNPPRSIGFTVRNYSLLKDDAVSDLDLQSTFRLYAPAEFLGGMAFQVASVNENGTVSPVTPQYVLRTVIRKAREGAATIDTEKDFTADYGEIAGCEEILQLTSNFNADKGTGRITATAVGSEGAGTVLVLNAEEKSVNYSVAFSRGVPVISDGVSLTNDMSAPIFYADCEGTVVYYTLDITLPSMALRGGTAQEKQFVFYFTMTNAMKGEDLGLGYTEFCRKYEDCIAGSHFNASNVPLFDPENTPCGTATVKVVKRGETVSYFVGDKECSVTDGTAAYEEAHFSVEKLSDPAYQPQKDAMSYMIGNSIGKAFPVDVKVLFVQASQTEGGQK